MADKETPYPPFWINDRDHHGRPLEPRVFEAARTIWDRILREVSFKLKDPGRGPEIIEATAAAVSRALRRASRDPIRDVESYLAWACVRRINRIAVRESREQGGHATESLEFLAVNSAGNREDRLLDELRMKELLSNMDHGTREIFAMRVEGYSWKEIARRRGYANAHSAEVQFGKGLKAAKASLERRSRRGPESFGRPK